VKTFDFFCPGVPVSKGSLRAFVPKGWTRPVLTSTGGKPLKAWENNVAWAAKQAGVVPAAQGERVSLSLAFLLPRPKSMPRRIVHHAKKPDLDKLCRSVLDGLDGVAYVDDAQVSLLVASKGYATDGIAVGVQVKIEAWENKEAK